MLLFGAVESVVSVISFAAILWNLSGPLTLWGFTLPKAMFVIVFVYVLIATVVAFWIGRPLIRLSFRNELFNAAFRYALVRLRDAAEAVGFYRGERAERVQLSRRFDDTIANYRRYVARTLGFTGWNTTSARSSIRCPGSCRRLGCSPTKSPSATSTRRQPHSATSSTGCRTSATPTTSSPAIARRSSACTAWWSPTRRPAHLPMLATEPCTGDTIELDDVEVRTPAGDRLVDPLDLRLEPGDTFGHHRTVGQREDHPAAQPRPAVAVLLGHAAPARWGERDDVPVAAARTCRSAICAPSCHIPPRPAIFPTPSCSGRWPMWRWAISSFGSTRCQDWAKVLSPGEQQRVAFARILLTKPKAVFLDEATSALDEGLEFQMYELLRTRLPNTIVVSVSHRPTVEQHHEQHLELLGEGAWRLGRVEGDEPVPV